jgi:hypothetical protein
MKTLKIMPQIPARGSRDVLPRRPGRSSERSPVALPTINHQLPQPSTPADLDYALNGEIHRLTGLTPCPGCGS